MREVVVELAEPVVVRVAVTKEVDVAAMVPEMFSPCALEGYRTRTSRLRLYTIALYLYAPALDHAIDTPSGEPTRSKPRRLLASSSIWN